LDRTLYLARQPADVAAERKFPPFEVCVSSALETMRLWRRR